MKDDQDDTEKVKSIEYVHISDLKMDFDNTGDIDIYFLQDRIIFPFYWLRQL